MFEVLELSLLALTILLFFAALSTPFVLRRKLLAVFRAEMAEGAELLQALRSWNSRVLANMRRAGELPQAEGAAALEALGGGGGGLPPFVMGLAESLGIDVPKLMAGDAGEMLKVKGVLEKVKAMGPAQGQAPAQAATGPFL